MPMLMRIAELSRKAQRVVLLFVKQEQTFSCFNECERANGRERGNGATGGETVMSVASTWLQRLIGVESDKLDFAYRVREMLAMEIGLRLGILYEVCIRLLQWHGAVPDLPRAEQLEGELAVALDTIEHLEGKARARERHNGDQIAHLVGMVEELRRRLREAQAREAGNVVARRVRFSGIRGSPTTTETLVASASASPPAPPALSAPLPVVPSASASASPPALSAPLPVVPSASTSASPPAPPQDALPEPSPSPAPAPAPVPAPSLPSFGELTFVREPGVLGPPPSPPGGGKNGDSVCIVSASSPRERAHSLVHEPPRGSPPPSLRGCSCFRSNLGDYDHPPAPETGETGVRRRSAAAAPSSPALAMDATDSDLNLRRARVLQEVLKVDCLRRKGERGGRLGILSEVCIRLF
uniref:Uncharacterized protein n=1 Tax=Chromera velia CCMP2878 TaxID=1169474 RepID=A0A0G4FNR1_9ALVE|eukprot:Cvel_17971.t1-p1 / transcript=Cvel_17971.t1 / gene=Cvel_17971 / organism=Chromera_velia_CCMP2878 / gene_product=hypothetical protein / transcript_product=hypothetical protein / location=Cvel_scaffold1463:11068-22379(-) / protein_length=411 / sequence_SO=supercontig / SO=protein_coding / is_pseudo=false